jgi:hypothetical protein
MDKPVWGHIPRYVPLYLIRHWRISASLVTLLLGLLLTFRLEIGLLLLHMNFGILRYLGSIICSSTP